MTVVPPDYPVVLLIREGAPSDQYKVEILYDIMEYVWTVKATHVHGSVCMHQKYYCYTVESNAYAHYSNLINRTLEKGYKYEETLLMQML